MAVQVKNIKIGDNLPFVLIAGPCVVESEELIFFTARKISEIAERQNIPFIFKSSFKKANRTNLNSFSGLGDGIAISILKKVRDELNLPVLTDIHTEEDIEKVIDSVDVIQIPAFLCRQTELLVAAGNSCLTVNIKKGQFLAPEDMKHAADKVASTGNDKILLTERGTTFGYHNLVVDMRSLVIMRELGYPVVMDATHSVQLPSKDNVSGGQPKFIKPLARAAAAVGIDALFLEVHPEPSKALSDAASQLPLSELEELLIEIKAIDSVIKSVSKQS
ncbi:2-dehydro-3-deoxyphosphooctonate aldolase [Ignavibacterium album JCM 16511]|uniref:3-deoxy-8-phosphooctulonate synthase n=1 Tax=Ignavibacterium album (strain DSM 19864 / JCM 16511 / NBRC 101810 / Mat9-16) TaxID=945713 RepID=I0AKU5_IGNAJ|nr:3-deoxy-8-phosphooctulonate synthase [Ignavibacterium album]AFH49602.1 2-dehydro-3-deoxyphosphooctonate aldolase [Ignavibacterium album JCM 16511]